ncbi:MAG: class I SAM-dependent methyltransferase [Pirellulales bacterium]|nr:class I SAM-dependent methyltransferase [Pirellulales bacterium]
MAEDRALLGGEGLRVVPGVTHQRHDPELVRHLARYRFARWLIAADIRRARPPAAPQIVDLGCGAGYGAAELGRIPGVHVLGLDHDPAVIEHAQRRYGGGNVAFRVADLRSMAAETATAACAYLVALEVLEHLPDGLELFACLRWTRLAVVSTPYLEPPGRNPHHARWNISEAEYAAFPRKAFFYQDLPGVIYAACDRPPQAVNLLCVLFAEQAEGAVDAIVGWLDWQRAAYRARRLLPDAWEAFKDLTRPVLRPMLRRVWPERYQP